MKRPWMPLYVGDYLGDTGHLTTAQHGAYLLLMMHYWRKGELPDDDRQLSKITKLPLKTWCEYRPTLQDFFHSGWRHKRIDAELERMLRVSEKRAIAGQKGGLGSALARMKLENASRSRTSAASNCFAVAKRSFSRRRPLTPTLISESFSHRGAFGFIVSLRARQPKRPPFPSAPSLQPMSQDERHNGESKPNRTRHRTTRASQPDHPRFPREF